MRVFIGLAVLVGAIALAAEWGKHIQEARHARYVKCVESGIEPLRCSFIAVFN